MFRMEAGDFVICVFMIAAMFGMSQILAHISCYIARLTKKKICRCWDCPKKCELYQKSEPEPQLDLDNEVRFFCGYCNHSICLTSENNNTIKKFHKFCGHCGNKVNWSLLDESEWYMNKNIKSFGKVRH